MISRLPEGGEVAILQGIAGTGPAEGRPAGASTVYHDREAALNPAIPSAQGKEYTEPIYLPLTLVSVDNVAELDNWA